MTISGYVDVPPADRAAFAQALPEHSRLTNLEIGCHYFRVTPDPVLKVVIWWRKVLMMTQLTPLIWNEPLKRNGRRLRGISSGPIRLYLESHDDLLLKT